MSVTGIILMWVWFVATFAILSKWPMGKKYGHRKAYWARFEGK